MYCNICIFIIYTRNHWNIHLHPVMINVSKNCFPHMFEHFLAIFFSNRIILLYSCIPFLFYLVDAPWQYVSNLVLFEYFQSIYLYRLRKLIYRCTYCTCIYICTFYIYIHKLINHLLEPHYKHIGVKNDLRCVYKNAAGILYLCLMSLSSSMITCTMHFLLCKPSCVDPSNFLQTTGHSAFLHMHQRVLPAVYTIYNVICKYGVVISIRRGVNVAYGFLYLFKYIDVTRGERALGTNCSSCETYINIYVGGTLYSLYITIFYISYM